MITETYYDTHAHFTLTAAETVAVLSRAREAGVSRVVAVGGNAKLNAGALAAAQAFPDAIRLALGFDRDQATEAEPEVFVETLRQLAETYPFAAVGETGLDFHFHPETAEAQCALFAAQLRLADVWKRPVIVHTREADDATLRVLDETPWHGQGLRGVIHCFTGDTRFAAQLLDRQMALSFSGIVTFRQAESVRASAAFVPDDRLLIETDSPYLAPVPMRGQRNEPAYVTHVAACLAAVRKTRPERVAEITTRNARALFG
ncbi:MAG TPA: TatD family hydrolase [Kiritimatiellia bacterium]|nr:TatD family hydrolase [Kiritimatiellia bacterium]HOR97234.1 TatD family hydrolase [Kiritimatiellia bacterium]HPK37130.1 TatD family hydrolase [Kiritimatiellia bacterium]HPW74971.1 TatD family hydrolase [Kiritimatiellia bacterium]